jgi:prepilin-type N-terminal cleavage/methylation domain-containing protein
MAKSGYNLVIKLIMKHLRRTKGFTLVELIVSVAILAAISIVLGRFAQDVFSLNDTAQSSLNAELDARSVVSTMVTELRKANESAVGGYPIALASSTGITFYSDVYDTGVQDQVRYFLNGTKLQKGIIVPTGSPLSYNTSSEVISTLISSVIASSTVPIFQYYPETYAGTSSPLTIPVDIPSVRLVEVTVIIHDTSVHAAAPIVVTSQVMLRNLKDNL